MIVRIMARQLHFAGDTDGRLLMVNLIPPDASDSAGAQMTLGDTRKRCP